MRDCGRLLFSENLVNRSPLEILSDALTQGECLLLVLSRKRKSAHDDFTKVSVRPVVVQQRPA